MDLKRSSILNITLRKIYPFIIIISLYMVAYSSNYPGGGFQAGVIAGTMIIVFNMFSNKRDFDHAFYLRIELIGFLIFMISVFMILYSDTFLENFYSFSLPSDMFSNIGMSLLNLSIYLEVTGSIVLIFFYFIKGVEFEKESF